MVRTPEDAKDDGNNEFKLGQFKKAIQFFSEAIKLADTKKGKGQVHIYYSNRSACYLSLDNAKNALQDAEECILLKPDWSKGYSRKAAALIALNKYDEAVIAYQNGLIRDATNDVLLQGLAHVKQLMNNKNSNNSNNNVQKIKTFLIGDKNAKIISIQFILRLLTILCFVGYFIPFFNFQYKSYYNFFKIAMVNNLISLYNKQGRPKFSTDYAFRLVYDTTLQYLFFCLIFYTSNIFTLSMLPIILIEITHVSYFFYCFTLAIYPEYMDINIKNNFILSKLNGLLENVSGHQNWNILKMNKRWDIIFARIPEICAFLEIMIGCMLLVELFLPSRNIPLCFVYWQFMKLRYMISRELQNNFKFIHYNISIILNNPKCPRFLGSGYHKTANLLANMTRLPTASEEKKSPFSKCSIM